MYKSISNQLSISIEFCSEVFSLGKLPYGKLTNAEVVEKIREGYRLDKPKQWCPAELMQVMKMCWQEAPEKRPSFQKIEQWLLRLKERDLDGQIVSMDCADLASRN